MIRIHSHSLALVVVLVVAVLALLFPAAGFAVEFDYEVERFRVVGNLVGDQTDEFDDGSAADWNPRGDVSEFDGALHLEGPGIEDEISYSLINPDIVLSRSDAFAPGQFWVADGSGDFTATSTWRDLPDLPGGFFAMGVFYFLPNNITEIWSVSASNFDPITAAAFGRPAGLSMTFNTVTFDQQTEVILTQSQESFEIDPLDVLGHTLLQLEYDDATNELVAAFSLDGGSSFQRPFASRAVSLDPVFNSFLLLGDPATVPEPSTALLLGLGLAALGTRRSAARSGS